MSREPALAPKERSDTSIARQGYDQGPTPMPRSERPSDHRPHIPRRPLSTGLSDLMIMPFWFHSPALRFGLCWYHVGLSALAHGIGKLAPKVRPDTSVARQGYDPDTSIARQGYDLKDRRIIAAAQADLIQRLFRPH